MLHCDVWPNSKPINLSERPCLLPKLWLVTYPWVHQCLALQLHSHHVWQIRPMDHKATYLPYSLSHKNQLTYIQATSSPTYIYIHFPYKSYIYLLLGFNHSFLPLASLFYIVYIVLKLSSGQLQSQSDVSLSNSTAYNCRQGDNNLI